MKYWWGIFLLIGTLRAQYAPPAGQAGSTALPADTVVFVGGATAITLERGPQDIAQPDLGLVTNGQELFALGMPDDSTVSLGDGGSATLRFEPPITDGTGFDFAIFENAFNDTFLELAFVEVSSNGIDFVRFPAVSLTQTDTPVGSFGEVDATKINNLAGKYRARFGTPFDLAELPAAPGFDPAVVTHVRIIDCIGSIDPDFATFDSAGNAINDIYPTPFATGGFDLDAVVVIHQFTNTEDLRTDRGAFYPNPVRVGAPLYWSGEVNATSVRLCDQLGRQWVVPFENRQIELPVLAPGIYMVSFGGAPPQRIIVIQ